MAEALKPQYMIGCKRPTSHAGFLPVFNQPNVTLVDTQGKGIDEITAKGVRFAGVEYELDVLILATGGCHPGRLQDPIGLPKVLLPARPLAFSLACVTPCFSSVLPKFCCASVSSALRLRLRVRPCCRCRLLLVAVGCCCCRAQVLRSSRLASGMRSKAAGASICERSTLTVSAPFLECTRVASQTCS